MDTTIIEDYDTRDVKHKLSQSEQVWKKYKKYNDGPRPTPKEIADKVLTISRISLRDAAFIATLYLLACRVEEVCRYIDGKTNKIIGPALLRNQISEEIINGKPYLRFRNRVLKLKETNYGIAKNKLVPYSENSIDWPFIKIIEAYIDSRAWKPDEELFPFNYDNAYRIVSKYFNCSPHNFRSWRCKSLVEDFKPNGMTPQVLQSWVGWKDSKMAMQYSRADLNAVISTFENNILWDGDM